MTNVNKNTHPQGWHLRRSNLPFVMQPWPQAGVWCFYPNPSIPTIPTIVHSQRVTANTGTPNQPSEVFTLVHPRRNRPLPSPTRLMNDYCHVSCRPAMEMQHTHGRVEHGMRIQADKPTGGPAARTSAHLAPDSPLPATLAGMTGGCSTDTVAQFPA